MIGRKTDFTGPDGFLLNYYRVIQLGHCRY
jgi:hypothetical protein